MILLISCVVLSFLNFYLPSLVEKVVKRFILKSPIQVSEREQIATLRKKMDEINMKERFADYARLQRELNRVKQQVEAEERRKAAKRWTYGLAFQYGTRVVLSIISFAMFWWYRSTPVVILKEDWLEPVSSILSWPTHIPGALSFPVWYLMCNTTVKISLNPQNFRL